MAGVNYTLLLTAVVSPNDSHPWFWDAVKQGKMRWFCAVPAKTREQKRKKNPTTLPPHDQSVDITEVFHILKGGQHPAGWGGEGSLQLNVTVRNRMGDPAYYELYQAEQP